MLDFAQILFLLISWCEVINIQHQAYMVTFVTITVNIAVQYLLWRTKIICFGLPKAATIKMPLCLIQPRYN